MKRNSTTQIQPSVERLSSIYAVESGSATVTVAVLGVSPSTRPPTEESPFSDTLHRSVQSAGRRLVRPGRVALPISTALLASSLRPYALCCLMLLVVTVFLATGCATSESGSRPARPGAGLAEYRQLVADLRKAVMASRQSAETLTTTPESKSAVAHARFDESVQRLEVVSLKARARADAMEKRGEAYFEEWAEEIKSETGGATKERFTELRQHFDEILKGSRQVRQAFRQYLDGLRGVSSSLGLHPVPAAIEKARPTLTKIVSDGRQAEETLDQLLNTLSAAQAAVMSGPMPPPKSGDKP